MRYIGVDLHTTQLTVCYMSLDGTTQVSKFSFDEIERFLASLEATDELAVEATGNSSWFIRQVAEQVSRVVLVNSREFEITKKSVKKTDRRDAVNLARFLRADLLPEARLKSERATAVQSLNALRAKLVETRTALINKAHGLLVGNGRKERRERLTSEVGSQRVIDQYQWSASEQIELEVIQTQLKALKESINRIERAMLDKARQMKGFESLVSIKGIGERSAALLLAVIGEVEDFDSPDKLASYFGIVPQVRNSSETIKHGRITKLGSRAGRTTLVQCTLIAIKYSEYLRSFYERIKERRGAGKAIIATARKFLGIIYKTLKHNWVFADFPNFVLAE